MDEKHTPRIMINEDTVEISFGPHPMEEGHYIHWVELYEVSGTPKMLGRVEFSPHVEPFAVFKVKNPKKLMAVAYCNLHRLFKTEVEL